MENYVDVTITAMGDMGDGIALHSTHRCGKPIFVPLTCVGDVARVSIEHDGKDTSRGRLVTLLTPSPHRQTPECEHFETCGGCALQHLNEDTYRAFKQHTMQRMLSHMGITESSVLRDMVSVGAHSRRRIEWKVAVNKGDISLGFMSEKSHHVVDLTHCPVTETAITELLPALKACMRNMKKPSQLQAIYVTALDDGLDILLHLRTPLNAATQQLWSDFATTHRLVRLCQQVEEQPPTSLFQGNNAHVTLSGIDVTLPVGAFLQASRHGQAIITECVTTWLQGCGNIADIYAGCGTYSFALRHQAERIAAYEGAPDMVNAMHNAIAAYHLDERISANHRDIFTHPLSAVELGHVDGIVINPPRNGALPQVKRIAEAGVPTVVMVSCNPATFQRDGMHLLQEGYRMDALTPIDQFYWSRHLEVVAVFRKV